MLIISSPIWEPSPHSIYSNSSILSAHSEFSHISYNPFSSQYTASIRDRISLMGLVADLGCWRWLNVWLFFVFEEFIDSFWVCWFSLFFGGWYDRLGNLCGIWWVVINLILILGDWLVCWWIMQFDYDFLSFLSSKQHFLFQAAKIPTQNSSWPPSPSSVYYICPISHTLFWFIPLYHINWTPTHWFLSQHYHYGCFRIIFWRGYTQFFCRCAISRVGSLFLEFVGVFLGERSAWILVSIVIFRRLLIFILWVHKFLILLSTILVTLHAYYSNILQFHPNSDTQTYISKYVLLQPFID